MYAGWVGDCCDQARELVGLYGEAAVWTFAILINGYPITWDAPRLSSGKLKHFLKVWKR
jgi:hypothetical protein